MYLQDGCKSLEVKRSTKGEGIKNNNEIVICCESNWEQKNVENTVRMVNDIAPQMFFEIASKMLLVGWGQYCMFVMVDTSE
jgi:hypothetical protein